MTQNDCIFCKIISQEIPSTIIKENEKVLVIEDLHPKAPVHYLLIPKIHVENIMTMTDEQHSIGSDLVAMAQELGSQVREPKGFNLISNNGVSAGQSVFHLHWHFLAGRNIYSGGLSL